MDLVGEYMGAHYGTKPNWCTDGEWRFLVAGLERLGYGGSNHIRYWAIVQHVDEPAIEVMFSSWDTYHLGHKDAKALCKNPGRFIARRLPALKAITPEGPAAASESDQSKSVDAEALESNLRHLDYVDVIWGWQILPTGKYVIETFQGSFIELTPQLALVWAEGAMHGHNPIPEATAAEMARWETEAAECRDEVEALLIKAVEKGLVWSYDRDDHFDGFIVRLCDGDSSQLSTNDTRFFLLGAEAQKVAQKPRASKAHND